MTYGDYISIVMAVISFSLERERPLRIYQNFNHISLGLNEKGFVLKEKSRFGAELVYGEELVVSPSYVINIFFCDNASLIADLVDILPDCIFENSISFVNLVDFIDDMRNTYNTYNSQNPNSSVIDINYAKFKQLLSMIKLDGYVSLKNKIKNLRKLSYIDLINIRNVKPELARKLERMYQIESLLIKYCKNSIIGSQMDLDDLYPEDYDFLPSKIDLDKFKIDWNIFASLIATKNCEEMSKEDDFCKKISNCHYYPKLSVLGLDEVILPGTPKTYRKDIR